MKPVAGRAGGSTLRGGMKPRTLFASLGIILLAQAGLQGGDPGTAG